MREMVTLPAARPPCLVKTSSTPSASVSGPGVRKRREPENWIFPSLLPPNTIGRGPIVDQLPCDCSLMNDTIERMSVSFLSALARHSALSLQLSFLRSAPHRSHTALPTVVAEPHVVAWDGEAAERTNAKDTPRTAIEARRPI